MGVVITMKMANPNERKYQSESNTELELELELEREVEGAAVIACPAVLVKARVQSTTGKDKQTNNSLNRDGSVMGQIFVRLMTRVPELYVTVAPRQPYFREWALKL